MVTVETLLHGEIELKAVPLKVEHTLHRIMIKKASFYVKIITYYLTLTTCFPSAPDDSSVFFLFFLSEIRNHNFLYVAMVTGLALSSRGEELVFCSHRGLNSCWTRWPADMEQQLPSQRLVPALSYICLGWLVFVPEFFAARQSHQMWVFTSGRRPHSSRCGERVLMLPPRGGSRGGMMVWTVLHQKRAVLCCSECHVSKWLDTWTKLSTSPVFLNAGLRFLLMVLSSVKLFTCTIWEHSHLSRLQSAETEEKQYKHKVKLF